MSRLSVRYIISFLLVLFVTCANAEIPEMVKDFYPETMNAVPPMPADLQDQSISCNALHKGQPQRYKTSAEINYTAPHWQRRIQPEWQFFSADQVSGRIVLIDYAYRENDTLAFRYLGNANQFDQLYEPWSSSKIFAYSGAVSVLRTQGIGGKAHIGDVSIADLITSIHSYQTTRQAPADSNAIATFFANIAGRELLTGLFHDKWLLMDNPDIRFRGAYGPHAYEPSANIWQDGERRAELKHFEQASDDPSYQVYRCDQCGLTGNKPMTALAQAEWLKRLATHDRVLETRHPGLMHEDIQTLFYGADGKGGMMAGISQMLHNALAAAIEPNSNDLPVDILNRNTQGQWRVFQKIGWGPSETRGAGENVVLAHVCLPHYHGGREFTLAAQTAQNGNGDIFVNYAGLKMQNLLTRSFIELLAVQD